MKLCDQTRFLCPLTLIRRRNVHQKGKERKGNVFVPCWQAVKKLTSGVRKKGSVKKVEKNLNNPCNENFHNAFPTTQLRSSKQNLRVFQSWNFPTSFQTSGVLFHEYAFMTWKAGFCTFHMAPWKVQCKKIWCGWRARPCKFRWDSNRIRFSSEIDLVWEKQFHLTSTVKRFAV